MNSASSENLLVVISQECAGFTTVGFVDHIKQHAGRGRYPNRLRDVVVPMFEVRRSTNSSNTIISPLSTCDSSDFKLRTTLVNMATQ